MRLETVQDFVGGLSGLDFPDVFNPYRDICSEFDLAEAADIRCENLGSVLEAALRRRVGAIWIGRDLGFRGGRRTGLALTDEQHLIACADMMGCRPLHRATRGATIGEPTATAVWTALAGARAAVFLWNVFPLHPHEEGKALTNMPHRRAEADACRPYLEWLFDRVAPRHVVAIGRDAYTTLARIGIDATPVRHPSYGGKTVFLSSLGHPVDTKANHGAGRYAGGDFKARRLHER